jgi:enolase
VSSIERIHGRQILDAQGFPTVEVEVVLDRGAAASGRRTDW